MPASSSFVLTLPTLLRRQRNGSYSRARGFCLQRCLRPALGRSAIREVFNVSRRRQPGMAMPWLSRRARCVDDLCPVAKTCEIRHMLAPPLPQPVGASLDTWPQRRASRVTVAPCSSSSGRSHHRCSALRTAPARGGLSGTTASRTARRSATLALLPVAPTPPTPSSPSRGRRRRVALTSCS